MVNHPNRSRQEQPLADLMRAVARLDADRSAFTVEAEMRRMSAYSEKLAEYRERGGDMGALDREIARQNAITDQAIADGEYYDGDEA
jgi:hypothetical protein